MLVVSFAIYEVAVRPQITHKLVSYWAAYYVPTRSPSAAISFLHLHLHLLAPYMGFRFLVIDAVLALAGIAALLWLRRFALAAMFPMTLVIVIVASAARKYPFGDLRTSTFWLVAVPLLMAVAVAAAGQWAAATDRRAATGRCGCGACRLGAGDGHATSGPMRYPTRMSALRSGISTPTSGPGTWSSSVTQPATPLRITTGWRSPRSRPETAPTATSWPTPARRGWS